jgi:predicted phage terminase large subunit-like protein
MVRTLSAKWPAASAKLVEDKANGPAVVAALKRTVTGMLEQAPDGSKDARLAAVSPLFEAGNVYLPDPTAHPWVHDFIDELAAAAPAHDDQRDACAQALRYLHGKSTRLVEAMARLAKDGNRMV